MASRLIYEPGIGPVARTVQTGMDEARNFSLSVSLRDTISTLGRNDLIAVLDFDLQIGITSFACTGRTQSRTRKCVSR